MSPALLSVDQARALIRERAAPLRPCRLRLAEALGRVLSEDALSDVDSPPHNKAMMDGYAILSSDAAAERTVIEEVIAGAVPTKPVAAGQATRIMTGAPMPAGADAVVPVEQTELIDPQTVRLHGAIPVSGKHVMPRGQSFRAGEVVASAGGVITPHLLALLAECGHAEVAVVSRPTVGVLATGDELVAADQVPGDAQIRDSNGPMLTALVQEAGCLSRELGVARDNESSLKERIKAGRAADVLLLSGGVSAGKRDLAPAVLERLRVEPVFHKVAVKPGKPLWFGAWPRDNGAATLVFGLPGNPVSGFVCFHLFVRPALSVLAGDAWRGLPETTAELTLDLPPQGGREAYLPSVTRLGAAGWTATPTAWRGSADLRGLAAANSLIRVPLAADPLANGDAVQSLLLPGFWSGKSQNS